TNLLAYLSTDGLAAPLSEEEAKDLAQFLSGPIQQQVYPHSITASNHALFFLSRRGGKKSLSVISADESLLNKFDGVTLDVWLSDREMALKVCDTTSANAAALRSVFPFLNPRPLGLKKSAGCGDRLGLATPGHVRAIRHSSMAPILPQQ